MPISTRLVQTHQQPGNGHRNVNVQLEAWLPFCKHTNPVVEIQRAGAGVGLRAFVVEQVQQHEASVWLRRSPVLSPAVTHLRALQSRPGALGGSLRVGQLPPVEQQVVCAALLLLQTRTWPHPKAVLFDAPLSTGCVCEASTRGVGGPLLGALRRPPAGLEGAIESCCACSHSHA